MYLHAYRQREVLKLDAVEVLLTRSSLYAHAIWIGHRAAGDRDLARWRAALGSDSRIQLRDARPPQAFNGMGSGSGSSACVPRTPNRASGVAP